MFLDLLHKLKKQIIKELNLTLIINVVTLILTVVGVVYAIRAFNEAEKQSRQSAINTAWSILAIDNLSGNNGKKDAIETLAGFHVNLRGINIGYKYANIRTNLNDLNLSNADLQEVNFNNSTLYSAKFNESNFNSAIFNHIELLHAEFKNCTIGAEFLHSNVHSTEFNGGSLLNSKFNESNITDCNFINVINRYTDFNKTSLSDISFYLGSVSDANFRKANLFLIEFIDTDISYTKFDGAELNNIKFNNVNLTHADFSTVKKMENVSFRNCWITTIKNGKYTFPLLLPKGWKYRLKDHYYGKYYIDIIKQ